MIQYENTYRKLFKKSSFNIFISIEESAGDISVIRNLTIPLHYFGSCLENIYIFFVKPKSLTAYVFYG